MADDLQRVLAEALREDSGEAVGSLVELLFELHPGLRERFVDEVLTDLCEQIAQREDPRHSLATVRLIEDIKTHWENA
jgi:hypothetical protein